MHQEGRIDHQLDMSQQRADDDLSKSLSALSLRDSNRQHPKSILKNGKSVSSQDEEDELYVQKVRERFERDFLPRFGPLWSTMVKKKAIEASSVKPAPSTSINNHPPANFMDAIQRKEAVTFIASASASSPKHDQECTCGCSEPIEDFADQNERVEVDNEAAAASSPDYSSADLTAIVSDSENEAIADFFDLEAEEIDRSSSNEGSDDEEEWTEGCESDDAFTFQDVRANLPESEFRKDRAKKTFIDDDSEDENITETGKIKGRKESTKHREERAHAEQALVDTDSEAEEDLDSKYIEEKDGSDSESWSFVEESEIEDDAEIVVVESSDEDAGRLEELKKKKEHRTKKNAKRKMCSGNAFRRNRDRLTKSGFAEFNRDVFGNRLGSVEVEWSKKLNSTAGQTRLRKSYDNMMPGTPLKRLASVELSTKVLDTEERLRTTLLHELIHAAVWVFE